MIRRALTPEVKIINAKLGLVDYVASDETLDCYQEIIKASGWKFTNFAKNAPFVDSHDYSSISSLLGKVVSWRIENNQLVQQVQWAKDVESQPLAKLGWDLTEQGFLKAVSVGFIPTKAVNKWSTPQGDFLAAVAELKLTPEQAASVRTIFLEQEQFELSACCIGANPNALAKAHKAGAVKDAQLAAVGFTDDDMTFLHESADAWERIDGNAQLAVIGTLKAITRKTLSAGTKTQNDSPASDAADAGESMRQQRSDFLAELRNLSSTHS